MAAALVLMGAVSFSWGAPAGQEAPPPGSPFVPSEQQRAEEECGKGTADFRKYYGRFLGRPFEDNLICAKEDSVTGSYYAYARSLACLDLAGDVKWSCGFLVPAKGKPAELWSRCQEARVFFLFSWAVLRGGDPKAVFPQLLEDFLEGAANGLPASGKEKLFQGFAKAVKTGDIQPLCAESVVRRRETTLQGCLQWAGFFTGDPSRCSAGDPKLDRERCVEKAALLAALRSADPKACAALPWCDVLAKRQAAGCAPLIKEANSVFCRAIRELTKGKAPPPVDTAKRDREARQAKEKAMAEEAARKEKERLAEIQKNQKKKIEEERVYNEKLVAAEIRLAHEVQAKKREQDEKVRLALEERRRKKQFSAGQRMDPGPLDAMKQIEAVNSGKPLPVAKEIKDE
ncbi:MAG: hypothetical protein HZB91_01730 [Elusimicrobia bacterium]|nr:hypothetical protein [Elusimicrobiota bacterium]